MCVNFYIVHKNRNMAAQGSSRRFLFVFLFIASIGGAVLFMFKGCSDDLSPIQANILLVNQGKNYVFSGLPSDQVQSQIDAGKLPAVFNNLSVYKNDDIYYMKPSDLKELVSVASGEYVLHTGGAGASGYVSVAHDKSFTEDVSYKAGAKLGQQDAVHTVLLTNAKGGKMTIQWTRNSREYEFYDLKNCEVQSFWVETNPAPGQTVLSSNDYLVVDLNKIASFFNCTITFDTENALVVVSR